MSEECHFILKRDSYVLTAFVNIAIMSVLQKWDKNGQAFWVVSQYSGDAGTMNARKFFASKHILLLSIVFIRW